MTFSTLSLLYIFVGALIGYVVASVLLKSKSSKQKELEAQVADKTQGEALAIKQFEFVSEELKTLKAEQDQLRLEYTSKIKENAKLESEKASLLNQMDQYGADLKELKSGFQKEFEVLANRIFEEKSEKFVRQNKSSLDQVINPLKERIHEFKERVEQTHASTLKDQSSLRQELKHLKEMSQLMSNQAENLTNALTNDNKAQGNWGEMILENILESSGLEKDRNYFIQKSFVTDEGKRLQPDVLIKLPDNKWIAIDSKVSLTAYERYVNAKAELDKTDALKKHLGSLKAHFKGLSGKRYEELADGKNLDFILMFVPIEPAYLLAMHGDQNLFNQAYEHGVVMVSPSTLIASLKIIASTWKHEYQNKNALEIANRGKLLLEKFHGFIEDFTKIGEQLNRADKAYLEALKKLRDGNGNLISQAKQLEELGVKSKNKLDQNLGIE